MHTVVVGGGFAGVKAALEISERQIGRVTLISDEDYFLYHATLYATATGRDRDESVIQLKDIFENRGNVKIVKDKIKAVDADRRMVVGSRGSYSYSKLILAIGVETTYFNIDGLRQHSFGIKTLKEVKEFNRHLHNDLINTGRLDTNYFVIGAGPTGVELAASLAEYLRRIGELHEIKRINPKITLVEASERILPRLSKTASRKVQKQLEKMGVRVLTSTPVQKLDDDSIRVKGREYKTRTAIWTSGVSNHSFYEKHKDIFELAPNGRVEVDPYLMAAKNIYVLGDNANTPYTGVAPTALSDGKFIAKHLARIYSKRALAPRRFIKLPVAIPVGEDWSYVEWFGVYIAGRPGAFVRRLIELKGYLTLLPLKKAWQAWRAHDKYEESCRLCKKFNEISL